MPKLTLHISLTQEKQLEQNLLKLIDLPNLSPIFAIVLRSQKEGPESIAKDLISKCLLTPCTGSFETSILPIIIILKR